MAGRITRGGIRIGCDAERPEHEKPVVHFSREIRFGGDLSLRHWWNDLGFVRSAFAPRAKTTRYFCSIRRLQIGWPDWAAGSANGNQ